MFIKRYAKDRGICAENSINAKGLHAENIRAVRRVPLLKFCMFAAAFVLALIISETTGAKADPVTGAAVTVSYTNEEITITSPQQIYYTVLKKADATTVKLSTLLEAVKSDTDKYLIDFSTVASTKESYIGYTTTAPGADTTATTTVSVVTLIPSVKKCVYTIDWAKEDAAGYGILKKVAVTGADNNTVTYESGTVTETSDIKMLTEEKLPLQWKKGANGSWKSLGTLTNAQWKSMQVSGAMLYLRVNAAESPALRYSKEFKIKVARGKAPVFKVDISRLTLPVKNGTQYRVAGASEWQTILPYSTKGTMTCAAIEGSKYDISMSTNVKVKTLTLDEIMGTVPYTMQAAGTTGGAVTIEIRNAATVSKPASFTTKLSFPLQANAPVCSVKREADVLNIEKLEKSVNDMGSASMNFEYLIISKADFEAGKLSMENATWKSIKQSEKLKLSTSCNLTLKDGSKKTYKLSDTDTFILVRRKGIAASSKAPALLASEYAKIEVPAASSGAVSGGAITTK